MQGEPAQAQLERRERVAAGVELGADSVERCRRGIIRRRGERFQRGGLCVAQSAQRRAQLAREAVRRCTQHAPRDRLAGDPLHQHAGCVEPSAGRLVGDRPRHGNARRVRRALDVELRLA